MNPIVKALHILSWIPIAIVYIFLIFLGLFMVPIALRLEAWPKILWLWGNDEEGCPPWWMDRASLNHWYTDRWPYWWWYAIRNPLNNSRFIFKDRKPTIESNWSIIEPMEAQPMINVGQDMAYRWAWSGPFAGYRRVWLNGQDKYSEIWFGWKIGSTVPGMGFTMQWRHKVLVGQ